MHGILAREWRGREREGEGRKIKEGERVGAIWKEGDRAFTSKAVRGA